MSTVPCIGCGGSTKVVARQLGGNIELDTCGLCGGTGTLDAELANGISAARDLQLGETVEKYKKTKSRIAETIAEPQLWDGSGKPMPAQVVPVEEHLLAALAGREDDVDPNTLRQLADALEKAQNPGMKGALYRTAKAAGKTAVGALKTKAAVQANKQLCALAKEHFPQLLPPGDAKVEYLLPIAIPLALMFGTSLAKEADVLPDFIPEQLLDGLEAAGEYAFKGISEDVMAEVAQKALPFLAQVAQLGTGLMSGKLVIAPIVEQAEELTPGEDSE